MNDRRHYPRHPVDFPLMVSLPELPEHCYPARALTLSLASIELHCPAELIAALLRQQQLPLMCHVTFQLPGQAAVHRIVAQVLTHRRLSQHQYSLVLLFRHDGAGQEVALDQALDSLVEAARA